MFPYFKEHSVYNLLDQTVSWSYYKDNYILICKFISLFYTPFTSIWAKIFFHQIFYYKKIYKKKYYILMRSIFFMIFYSITLLSIKCLFWTKKDLVVKGGSSWISASNRPLKVLEIWTKKGIVVSLNSVIKIPNKCAY